MGRDREHEQSLQCAGVAEIEAALDAGAPVGRLLILRGSEASPGAESVAVARLAERARAEGISVVEASGSDLRRLSRTAPPAPALALLGRAVDASPENVFAIPGAKWLLVGASYPGNVGAALRTAEIAGADAAFVDAELDRAGRRAALRTSMNAERFMPIHWEDAEAVIAHARRGSHRIVGVEDVGDRAPWEIDLRRPSLFVVGGEDRSLSAELLACCDDVIRLPMQGFIPCYNLQAAVAAVALERLRQAASDATPPAG